MTKTEQKFVVGIVVGIVALVSFILYVSTQPSCEDRGGKERLVGYITQTVMVSKVPVQQMTPIYTCEQ